MKVLIVGAGPIGCYTAKLLAAKSKNCDIQLIEEHSEIGRPVHCAGLVSADAVTRIKVPLKDSFIVNRIDGAELCLNGDSFLINRENVAVVIDRQKFDQALGEGLNISFDTRFMGIEGEGPGYLVETDKGEHYADIVIGADGAISSVRRAAGLKENIKYLRGVQFRMRYDQGRQDLVQVHFKNPFFAWVIPEGTGIVRVGILSHNPYHDLLEFLEERSINGEILEKFAGAVPMGRCSTRDKNLVLVGDAACQVKPLTQGGIYYGMQCAEILTDCIANNQISEYERLWQARFSKEIQIGLNMRKVYEKLSPQSLKELFALMKQHKEVLEKYGDFENHSRIIYALVSDAQMRSFLGDLLLHVFRDLHI